MALQTVSIGADCLSTGLLHLCNMSGQLIRSAEEWTPPRQAERIPKHREGGQHVFISLRTGCWPAARNAVLKKQKPQNFVPELKLVK